MNPLDPMGRMKIRKENEYASLRDSLKEAGIISPAQAESVIAKAQKKLNWSLAIGIIVATLLMLFFPEAKLLVLAASALFVFWVTKAVRSGQKYIRRYIDEELKS